MSRFQIFLAILGIALIGWLHLIYKIRSAIAKEKFAVGYLGRFRKYVESRGKDNEAYGRMIYESVRMQRQLGIQGIMSSYKPPGANYTYSGYQVLINMLPELHRTLNSDLLVIPSVASDYAQTLEELFVRHLGVLSDEKRDIRSEILNPFKAFRSGVQFILFLPAFIFSWFGLATGSFLSRLSRNKMVKLVSGFVAIITFVSAMVGLVVGWKDFITIIKGILGR